MQNTNEIEKTISEATRNDASHWAFIREWHVEPQSSDRTPASGAVAPNDGPASVRRSQARRAHQLAYKEWSQQRHDY
jgi:hypothetical protein